MPVRNAGDPKEECEMTTDVRRALFEIEFGEKSRICTVATRDGVEPT